MKKIDLNHWFLKDNNMEISLMNLVASIEIDSYIENSFCCLDVKDEEDKVVSLKFNTLEKAVSFVEDYIRKCRNNSEVLDKYDKFMFEDTIKIEKDNKKIFLFPEDIDREIINYYSKDNDLLVSVKDDVSIRNGKIDVNYYLIQHTGCDASRIINLTDDDLKDVFSSFVNELNYDLEDFKYCGGIHRVGYYFDEDTPHFDGIMLKVKEKRQNKIIKK